MSTTTATEIRRDLLERLDVAKECPPLDDVIHDIAEQFEAPLEWEVWEPVARNRRALATDLHDFVLAATRKGATVADAVNAYVASKVDEIRRSAGTY